MSKGLGRGPKTGKRTGLSFSSIIGLILIFFAILQQYFPGTQLAPFTALTTFTLIGTMVTPQLISMLIK